MIKWFIIWLSKRMIKTINFAGVLIGGTTFKKTSVSLEDVISRTPKCSLTWTEFIVDEISSGAEEISNTLGIQIKPSTLLSGYLSSYEDRGDVLGLMFPILLTSGGLVEVTPLLIYVRRDQIIMVHNIQAERLLKLSDYADLFFRKLPDGATEWPDRQTILLVRIIDEINEHNFGVLRSIVERAEQLEMRLGEQRGLSRELSGELSNIKRSMFTFLNAIWGSHSSIHSLRYGDAEMLSDRPEILAKFDVILADLERQIQTAEQVMEVLTAGMNVIQTEVSNRLAALVLWLTVFGTAVLVPNTLATIYGFLPFREAEIPLLILSIILATVLSSIVSYWYVWRWWRRPKEDYIKRMTTEG